MQFLRWRTNAGVCSCTSGSVPQKVQLFEETCSLSLQPLSQSVYFPELETQTNIMWKLLDRAVSCSLMISAQVWLTSPSPHEAAWTAPAECSAAPGPASALGSSGPVRATARRWSASVSHFLPWSRAVHCGAPGTAAPTGHSGQTDGKPGL